MLAGSIELVIAAYVAAVIVSVALWAGIGYLVHEVVADNAIGDIVDLAVTGASSAWTAVVGTCIGFC